MKIAIFCSLILFPLQVYSQDISDTIDFIKEKVESNDPLPNYSNIILFNEVLKVDAEYFTGKKLTQELYENLLMYGSEIYYTDTKTTLFAEKLFSIDIRGIEKVTVTKNNSPKPYYAISVYVKKGYQASMYANVGEKVEIKSINKMDIFISDNAQLANRIKKALIHLGKLKGSNTKDGDVF